MLRDLINANSSFFSITVIIDRLFFFFFLSNSLPSSSMFSSKTNVFMFGKLTYLGVFWVFFKHNTACSLWCSWILNVRKGSKPVHFFPLFYACSVMFKTKVCVYMRMVVLLNLENISHRFLAMLHLALWAALLLSRQQCSVTQSFWKMFQERKQARKRHPNGL